MLTPRHPFNKVWLLLLIPVIECAALLFWFYPRDLNLSQVRSSTIKNDKGQPAQLLWWTPPKGVYVFQFIKDGGKFQYGEMPGDWWMDGRCFKVAELGHGPEGMVKIFLYPEEKVDDLSDEDRTYLAQRKDLSPTVSTERLQDEWFAQNFSGW